MKGLQNGDDHEFEEVGKEIAGFGGGRVGNVVRVTIPCDDTVNLEVDVMDQGNKGIEASAHSATPPKGANISKLVKDEEED